MRQQYALIGLTKEEFVAVISILRNVRLGNTGKFETALSDLMIDLENCGCEGYYLASVGEIGEPEVFVTATAEGFDIRLAD